MQDLLETGPRQLITMLLRLILIKFRCHWVKMHAEFCKVICAVVRYLRKWGGGEEEGSNTDKSMHISLFFIILFCFGLFCFILFCGGSSLTNRSTVQPVNCFIYL